MNIPPASEQVHATDAPLISLASARRIAGESFAVFGGCQDLPSERDRNVLVHTEKEAFVLKVSNSAELPAVVDLENAAMRHVGRSAPDLPIPRLLTASSGSQVVVVDGDDGRRHLARMETAVPGLALEGREVDADLSRQVGAITARMSQALSDLEHPAGARTHVWDVRGVHRLTSKLAFVDGEDQRAMLRRGLLSIGDTVDVVCRLPSHVQHADVTTTNLLESGTKITGVVDFGDVHSTAAVCDLAVSLNSTIRSIGHHGWNAVEDLTASYLKGYQRHRPLSEIEAEAVANLVVARLVVTLVVSAWRAEVHPYNAETVRQYDPSSWTLLALMLDRPQMRQDFSRLASLTRRQRSRRGDESTGSDRRARPLRHSWP